MEGLIPKVQAQVPIVTIFPPAQKFPTFGSIINAILPNVFILAGVILLLLLIFGGFLVIVNAGGGNPQATEKGKQAVTYALLGFILIFAAYWIIQIIEYVTGIKIFEPEI